MFRPKTAASCAVSLAQLEPGFEGFCLDEIDGTLIGEIGDRRLAVKGKNATTRCDLVTLSSLLKFNQICEWRLDNPAPDMAFLNAILDPIRCWMPWTGRNQGEASMIGCCWAIPA